MIEVGTRVHSRSFRCDGTVISLGAEVFEVEWEGVVYGNPIQYPYSHLVDVHGEGAHVQVIPSDTVTTPPADSYRDSTVERLAYNTGTMEFELFMVWTRLRRMATRDDRVTSPSLLKDISYMVESIEHAADRLKPKHMLDGTVETPYLAAQIYANRK